MNLSQQFKSVWIRWSRKFIDLALFNDIIRIWARKTSCFHKIHNLNIITNYTVPLLWIENGSHHTTRCECKRTSETEQRTHHESCIVFHYIFQLLLTSLRVTPLESMKYWSFFKLTRRSTRTSFPSAWKRGYMNSTTEVCKTSTFWKVYDRLCLFIFSPHSSNYNHINASQKSKCQQVYYSAHTTTCIVWVFRSYRPENVY